MEPHGRGSYQRPPAAPPYETTWASSTLAPVRVLIFHGYLLRGTGSNVYTAKLTEALVRQGHEVHLLSQDRTPSDRTFVDAEGTWHDGTLEVRELRSPVRCTAYRPEIGGVLPVYVADRYEGVEARPFPELDEAELERYIEANVAAVRAVVRRARPEVALANHLVMGPVILARALAGTEVSYAVKIHGSALEYTVGPHPRFLPRAREGLAGARGVLVGSRHVAGRLWETMEDPALRARTRLGPPGVDVEQFVPRKASEAREGLRALAGALAETAAAAAQEPAAPASAFSRDAAATAAALGSVVDGLGRDRLVAYVGKLILAKGVDLLLAAWPLVLQRLPQARLVVVGFGAYREGFERLREALTAGDLDRARALAVAGRAEEGGPRAPLRHLQAFLEELAGDARELERYFAAAARLPEQMILTGRLEHDELAALLSACEAEVIPSTFPEAFGMVAAEAAACGALPVSAEHSGLAEVSEVLRAGVPSAARPLLSFALGPGAVREMATCLVRWLEAPEELRARTRTALVATTRARYSWEGVARGVIAAAEGRLEALPMAED